MSAVHNEPSEAAADYLLMLEKNLRRGTYASTGQGNCMDGSMTHDEMMESRMDIHHAIIESALRHHDGVDWFGVFDPVSFFVSEGSGDPNWKCPSYGNEQDRATFAKENKLGFNIILKTAQLIMEHQYTYDANGVKTNPWLEWDKDGEKQWKTWIYAAWSDMSDEVANAGSHNQPDMAIPKYFKGSHVSEIRFGVPFFRKSPATWQKKRKAGGSSCELRYKHDEPYDFLDYKGMSGGTKQGKSTCGTLNKKSKTIFGISLQDFADNYETWLTKNPDRKRFKKDGLLPLSTNLLVFIMVMEHEVLHVLLGRFLKVFHDDTELAKVQPNEGNTGKLHPCQTDEGHNETFIRLASLFYGFDGVQVGIAASVVDSGETPKPQDVDKAWSLGRQISDRAKALMDFYMNKKQTVIKTELFKLKF